MTSYGIKKELLWTVGLVWQLLPCELEASVATAERVLGAIRREGAVIAAAESVGLFFGVDGNSAQVWEIIKAGGTVCWYAGIRWHKDTHISVRHVSARLMGVYEEGKWLLIAHSKAEDTATKLHLHNAELICACLYRHEMGSCFFFLFVSHLCLYFCLYLSRKLSMHWCEVIFI